jgi:DNA-binding beta-propeller fold protein YncE
MNLDARGRVAAQGLDRSTGRVDPAAGLDELRRRRRRRPLLKVVAAMAVLAAVAMVGWAGGRWTERDRTVTGPTPAPALQVTATIGVGADPADVLISDGAVWVASSGESTVLRIDLATNQVTGRFQVGANPVRLAAGHGSVWVANSDASVSRIDPASGRVVPIPVAGIRPSELAVTDDAVWVISGAGVRLMRIDPDTNRQVAVPEGVPAAPLGIALVDRRLWVSSGPGIDRTGEVTVVDPSTDRVVDRLQAPGDGPLAVGAGSVWRAGVTTQAVYRLDPASGRQLAAIPLGVVPGRLTVAGGSLWVASASGRVTRIDMASNRVTGTFTVGGRAAAVAVGAGSVWVIDTDHATLIRARPAR